MLGLVCRRQWQPQDGMMLPVSLFVVVSVGPVEALVVYGVFWRNHNNDTVQKQEQQDKTPRRRAQKTRT